MSGVLLIVRRRADSPSPAPICIALFPLGSYPPGARLAGRYPAWWTTCPPPGGGSRLDRHECFPNTVCTATIGSFRHTGGEPWRVHIAHMDNRAAQGRIVNLLSCGRVPIFRGSCLQGIPPKEYRTRRWPTCTGSRRRQRRDALRTVQLFSDSIPNAHSESLFTESTGGRVHFGGLVQSGEELVALRWL